MSLTRLWLVVLLCLLPTTVFGDNDKALSKEQSALLLDREAWNKASEKDQDATIEGVASLLGADYKWLATKKYSCDGISHRIATFQHVKSGMQMNLIPGGTYQMGTDEKSSIDEKPMHKVTIQPMLIGKFEVRQSVFDKIGGYDARKWRGEDLPIERVSWTDAKKWLKRAGGELRLPSESEWEYACRGGSEEAFFWGPKAKNEYAWFRSNCKKTMKVTLHEKAEKWNSFGLIDILGNVSEWVEDDYIRDYSEGPYDHKPRYSKRANKKVIRGGCWLYPPRNTLRSYDRNYYRAAGQDYILGFRAARSIDINAPKSNKKAPPLEKTPKKEAPKEAVKKVEKSPLPKILLDREAWNKASEKDQDAAITAVSKRLGADYKWLATKKYSCDGISHRIATFQHVKSGMQMNLIPGGTYQMGTDEKSSIDEKPMHKVTIQPMLIGKFEVRQSIFDKIGGNDVRKWRGEDLPIERVSWTDAKKWLKRAGGELRLPSESEWEYACRGGSEEAFFWGPKAKNEYAWFRSNCKKTMKVTLHEKAEKWNSFGLIDILGNVSEWVEDDYIRDYSEGPYDHKPRYSKRANKKVIRGGCWLYPPRNTLRSYDRNYYRAAGQDYILGFRAARGLN